MLTELGRLAWLVGGLAGLCVAAGLIARCLRIRSLLEFALATYVLSWAWIVAVTLVLSPPQLVSRGWLIGGIAVGLLASAAAWLACGRPAGPHYRPVLGEVRKALRNPALLLLAVAVTLGTGYTVALAFFTPVNEGDALAYHLARAAFWRQEHGLGYVANAVDVRLNGNPPNAEIGQLATMLLSGSDRYVALPQLAAYAALFLCVAGIARRIGLGVPEALFGALVFATLPVVVVQAPGALNDLVVASFLAGAVVFASRPGRAFLVLSALALGLALGTKLTAVLALPTLVAVVAIARPWRQWPALALAGVAGLAVGSAWYAVNLVETGELDGGLAESFDQRVELSIPAVATNAMRLVLDIVDMPGAAWPYRLGFLTGTLVLGALGLRRARRSMFEGGALIAAAIVAASPLLARLVTDLGQRLVFRSWVVLGRPATAPFETGWGLNVQADPVDAWYGPVGALLLVAGAVVAGLLWRRGKLPALSLGLAVSPWILLLTLAVSIVWDPFRGRFLIFGVALAAATWGALLRWTALSAATAAIGAIGLALALANYQGKPSGIGDLLGTPDSHEVSVRPIWGAARSDAQARLRPGEPESVVFGFLDEEIGTDARVAVALRENDYLSPYFGPDLSRHVSLVDGGGAVPEGAEWLVLAPELRVRRCPESWRRELALGSGWRIERRLSADSCPALRIGR